MDTICSTHERTMSCVSTDSGVVPDVAAFDNVAMDDGGVQGFYEYQAAYIADQVIQDPAMLVIEPDPEWQYDSDFQNFNFQTSVPLSDDLEEIQVMDLDTSFEYDIPKDRTAANARERKRMRKLNSAYEVLRKRLPVREPKKLSKLEVLRRTVRYIYDLKQVLRDADEFHRLKPVRTVDGKIFLSSRETEYGVCGYSLSCSSVRGARRRRKFKAPVWTPIPTLAPKRVVDEEEEDEYGPADPTNQAVFNSVFDPNQMDDLFEVFD